MICEQTRDVMISLESPCIFELNSENKKKIYTSFGIQFSTLLNLL